MSLKRTIVVTLASAAMVLTVAAAPSHIAGFGAQAADAACANIWLYEFANKGGKSANAGCGDRSDLKNFTANIAPLQPCDGQLFTSYGTWNDCPSSVSYSFSGATEACLNNDSNYGGSVLKLAAGTSGWGNLASSFNNQTSSIDVANVNCFPSGNQ